MLCTLHLRLHRSSPHGEQNVLGTLACPVRQLNLMRTNHFGPRIKALNTVVFENAAIDIFQAVKLSVKLRLEHAPVKRPEAHIPTVSLRIRNRTGKLAGKDHKFLGHTATDHTGSAITVFFGQSHFRSALCRHPRGAYAPRTAANDEKIIIKAHAAFLSPSNR